MPNPFVAPTRDAKAFNCPLCGAYAQQSWQDILRHNGQGYAPVKDYRFSKCTHCGESLFWHQQSVVVPGISSAPAPNEDLSKEIATDYLEAASIAVKSPRGAAALLRLCVQKLCFQLGERGKNINDDIAGLVAKGLDLRVQQALDTVRVVGNEAVHPGELDINDAPDVAALLFVLVNAIANDMITQPRLRNEAYDKLPAQKLKEIEARNIKARNRQGISE